MFEEKSSGKSRGGFARAKALSPERRSDIARLGALARNADALPKATHEGPLRIGDLELPAAVLADGTRVLTSRAFLKALGRPWKGTYRHTRYPNFIDAKNLIPFVSSDIEEVLEPVEFRNLRGQKVVGYRAELLPAVCEVYLAARAEGELLDTQKRVAQQAEILVRGLSRIGIIALVDEATGYQRSRAKDALARILEEFIAKELRPWVKTFPDDYYAEIFRLRGLEYMKDNVRRPQYFGYLTNDIVYKRLAPGVLEELKTVTPRRESGGHKHQLFRRLTDNIGHPKLREHLSSVITVMKLSTDYKDFQSKLDRVHPRYDRTLELPFSEGDQDEEGL